ncbi:MAG TPA: hypothetical protein VGR61_03025 [Candidatus Dormibacteraeota bacterium]|nr:hypothetical protein [Candidatus Dormibacteraeota bacterium]
MDRVQLARQRAVHGWGRHGGLGPGGPAVSGVEGGAYLVFAANDPTVLEVEEEHPLVIHGCRHGEWWGLVLPGPRGQRGDHGGGAYQRGTEQSKNDCPDLHLFLPRLG